MLTYDLAHVHKGALYDHLYKCIRDDIKSGVLTAGQKLPSKRAFAANLGVSTVTVETAYAQLISEGYVISQPKRGYYVAALEQIAATQPLTSYKPAPAPSAVPSSPKCVFDFSSNHTNPAQFPFATWRKLLRQTMGTDSTALLERSPAGGVLALRQAICEHLHAFRGMDVSPEQVIVGAGTEYLYGLLIQLFGRDKIYCTENPGYPKVGQIYRAQGVTCRFADMDESGISVQGLLKTKADIAHICPTHQFPSGITMPVSRRYELLAWANAHANNYIIEDDYDSEFRLRGKPIPTLQSLDHAGKVVYLNTFSKSLAATVRISYMVLPPALAAQFGERLSFYACTVSNFEQLTLARFISEGYFEKHINRMRLYYVRKRQQVLDIISQSALSNRARVIGDDNGLHFLLALDTAKSDQAIHACCKAQGLHFAGLYEYYETGIPTDTHQFLLSYANLDTDALPAALEKVACCLD